jgi:hypothetical protein
MDCQIRDITYHDIYIMRVVFHTRYLIPKISILWLRLVRWVFNFNVQGLITCTWSRRGPTAVDLEANRDV